MVAAIWCSSPMFPTTPHYFCVFSSYHDQQRSKGNWLNFCLESLYASLRRGFVRHCSLGWLILLCNWSCVSHCARCVSYCARVNVRVTQCFCEFLCVFRWSTGNLCNHPFVTMSLFSNGCRDPASWVINGRNTHTPDSRKAYQALIFYDNFIPERSRL